MMEKVGILKRKYAIEILSPLLLLSYVCFIRLSAEAELFITTSSSMRPTLARRVASFRAPYT
jgi:hypothetical protein